MQTLGLVLSIIIALAVAGWAFWFVFINQGDGE